MKTKYVLKTSLCALGLAATGVLPAHAVPVTAIVTPNSNAGAEGAGNSAYPFDTSEFSESNPSLSASARYQEVFDASQFASLSGPTRITRIDYRTDAATGHAFSATLPDVRFDLSTTQANTGNLGATFADNAGADNVTVLGRGPLSIAGSANGSAGGPNAFDIAINLAQPFTYDPSQGNLLLDICNYAGGSTSTFDKASDLSVDQPSVASVFTLQSGVNSPTADALNTGNFAGGLITKFKFLSHTAPSAVPEPASWAEMLLGLVMIGAFVASRRHRNSRGQSNLTPQIS